MHHTPRPAGCLPKAGLFCLPTLSTHGYEVIAREAIPAMTKIVVEFLERYSDTPSN